MMTIGSQGCRLDSTGVEDACGMEPLDERDAAPIYRTLHRVDASKNSMRLWALIGHDMLTLIFPLVVYVTVFEKEKPPPSAAAEPA
jgi:hypothetical protein